MSVYVLIPSIEVTNANAQPLQYVIGFPAMTAFLGFGHNMALRLGAKKHEGLATVLHGFELNGEVRGRGQWNRRFYPYQMRAAGWIDKDDYVGTSLSLSTQPSVRCRMTVTVVIALPDDTPFHPLDVARVLRGGRIAGGTIMKHGKIQICHSPGEVSQKIPRSGWSVVERQDLMIKSESDKDLIDTMLRVTRQSYWSIPNSHDGSTSSEPAQIKLDNVQESHPSNESPAEPLSGEEWEDLLSLEGPPMNLFEDLDEDDESKDDEASASSLSWIQPSSLGYIGISSLKERIGARNDLPHIYVEPLLGLIQFQNFRKSGLHFWRFITPESHLYVATTQIH